MLYSSHALVALRRRLRLAVRAVAPALLLAALGSTAHAQTFYVDAVNGTCSNAGAGTEIQPYCSIAAALAAHSGPGVTIVVKPGFYREQVTIPASGAAGSPFVIMASGPGVVIDGSDDYKNTSLWAPSLGGSFLAASVTWTAKQVVVDGNRLVATTNTPDLMPANSFKWVAGQGLYVNLGGVNPGSRATFVGHRNYGFNIFTKSFVTMSGFEVTRTQDRGINIQNGCTDLVVSNNRVSLAFSYGIHTVNGQRITIEGNTVSDCAFHGIGLTAGAAGCVVRNNESFRNAKPDTRVANGIYLYGATGNTMSGNRLHDNQDTGLQFSGAANNNVSFNNRSWNNGDHGYDHLGSTGMTHVNDLAYGNFLDGFSFEGNATGCQLFNSISVQNGEFDLWVDANSAVGFASDHNLFWNSTAQAPVKFGSTSYTTLADYQLASGQDAHSKQADPKFANAAAADFRLLAGSPAIDAATSAVANWPATDVGGGVRLDDLKTANTGAGPVAYGDMGVFEFVPPADRPPVVTATAKVITVSGQKITFTVAVADADGDAIQSLTMVPVVMPANSGATFTPNASNTGGTFTWTPAATGNFSVKFVATNLMTGSATTAIQVKRKMVAMSEQSIGVPVVAMSQASPNPSAGAVSFALDLPEASDVDLGVYDMQGRRVWQETRSLSAGRSILSWNGLSSSRQRVGTGLYFVRAQVGDVVMLRRVIRF